MFQLKYLVLMWLSLMSSVGYSHEHMFDVPATFYKSPFVNPAEYLETYKGSSAALDCKEFHELKNLLISAAFYSKVNYGQDYSISTKSDIYKLLISQLPSNIEIKTRENSQLVMLKDIAEQLLINSRTLYAVKCSQVN